MPLLEEFYAGRILLVLGLTSTFIFGAIAARSKFRIVAVVLLFVCVPAAWATLFLESRPLFVANCLLGGAFFWLVGGVIVFIVVRTPTVTFDSVFGAICSYLLFGLAWALSYAAIYTLLPEAFSIPENPSSSAGTGSNQFGAISQFIYHSFVTMTTLGYGDITPRGSLTRSVTWMQAVVGQFYVAVVIAWLVSALPRPGSDKKSRQ